MPKKDLDRHIARGGNGSAPESTDIGHLSRAMLEKLSTTIEGELIPRLMLAFDAPAARETSTPRVAVDVGDRLDEFVHLLLNHDASVANHYVSALRASGVPLAAIYLDLLGPTARRLGDMWEEDECSFTDVTIGVCRMHEVLLEFSRCFDAPERAPRTGRSILITPAPGEQHTFGLFMVIEFFRRSGWNCFTGTPRNSQAFQQLVRERDFDAIGVSVSADHHIDAAAEQIAEIRSQPRSDGVLVLAGGRSFVDNPELASEIGADTVGIDAEDAVHKLNRLCAAKNKNQRR